MPDLPPAKRQPTLHGSELAPAPPVAYAELRCKTNFSFLEGASHPDELVERAAELQYTHLAITDRNSLAGVVRAHAAAKQLGLQLLIGAEITPSDALHVVLLATNRAAYGRLSRLITTGRRRAKKGECELRLDDIAAHQAGLLALVVLVERDDRGQHTAPLREHLSSLHRYAEIFGDRCYALASLHRGPDDAARLADFCAQATTAQVPLVACGNVLYHAPQRLPLHDVLTAVRNHTTVAEAGQWRQTNAQRYLRTPAELARLFAAAPAAITRTQEVANRCEFSLDELRYEYPEELCPAGTTPTQHLAELTWQGAARRYPPGVPDKVRQLIEHELQLISQLRYEAYFLTVWDLVRFARSRGILCQGRGSAANSAVCYSLGVTSVDPEEMDVLFERFVSQERDEAPDIDIDFEHERREEVLQYLYEKYGRERAGMTAEVITYRPRSAVRDVGGALGFEPEQIDRLAKLLDSYSYKAEAFTPPLKEAGLDQQQTQVRQLVLLVRELLGFPRHLSQHVGGMVITQGPLCELVPIENAAMPGRTVVEWDKDDLDQLGILKVDCLALGMLTSIRKCFELVEQCTGRRWTLATIPPGETAVYDMISAADTIGVFQIESRAQMSMLPRLRPRCFYDLVIEVAIVRPGPIQGDMVHPYLRRRSGEEPVEYPNEDLREVLHKTLGVPLFQEQAMRLAVVAAGFTPGEADQLRRAMGAWRRPGIIDQFRQKLLTGMKARGLDESFALRVFEQIRGFGEYGFPESHAASFALLVYVSSWLKCHYPAAFTAALLNSQPMGFYAPAQLVRDAREHHVQVLPCDVNHSTWDVQLERVADEADFSQCWAIRLGLRQLVGLPHAAAEQIVKARGTTPFQTISEFVRRTRLGTAITQRLAQADAFASLELSRRAALWQALGYEPRPLPLFDNLETADDALPPGLPPMPLLDEVVADYQTSGLSLKAHPMKFLREVLAADGILCAAQLWEAAADSTVEVAGLVLLRQRPSTARGITFVTLEDETGQMNLVVHQHTWQRYHQAASGASILLARGQLQRHHEVIHVVVDRLRDITSELGYLRNASRDFR